MMDMGMGIGMVMGIGISMVMGMGMAMGMGMGMTGMARLQRLCTDPKCTKTTQIKRAHMVTDSHTVHHLRSYEV